MSEETKPKVNGLRTAVRYGEMTPEEARVVYDKLSLASGWTSPAFEAWLSRRPS